MTKTKLKVTGMSHPRCVKTVVDVLTTLDSIQRTKVNPRKVASVSLSFISGILIAFFSIVGCSDMPYTGSMMTTNDIDQYIVSPNEELICLQNGTDSECLTLIPKETEKVDSINGPIIHIHPEKLAYIFYHEGKEIVRAEKAMDTTEIVETLTEPREDPPPPTSEPPSGTAGDDPNANNNPDDIQQPITPPQQPQTPTSGGIQQPSTPPQTSEPPSGTAGDDSNANNNSDDTQQPTTPTPPPQQPSTPPQQPTDNSPDGTGSVGDDPADDNNRDDTPPPPTPTPPPPQQPSTPPQQPPPAHRHYSPDTMYSSSPAGWYVTIYYPENYTGEVHPTSDAPGFNITPSNGAIRQPIEIKKTSCGILSRPCNNHIDEGNPMTYSAQILIETQAQNLNVQVKWIDDEAHWDGNPPPTHYLTVALPGGTQRIMIEME